MRVTSFLVVGANNSRATSVFKHLNDCLDVCRSNKKETIFSLETTKGNARPLSGKAYTNHWVLWQIESCALEATPANFIGGEAIIETTQRISGDPKVVVTLRETVSRI